MIPGLDQCLELGDPLGDVDVRGGARRRRARLLGEDFGGGGFDVDTRVERAGQRVVQGTGVTA